MVLGLGGSATNDAGIGILLALGFSFQSKSGFAIKGRGQDLIHIDGIGNSSYWEKNKIPIEILCDVQSVLYGPGGAAYLYPAQKGADEDMVISLDKGLKHFSEVVSGKYGPYHTVPGTGASGGTSFGCMAMLGAQLFPGVEQVMHYVDLEEKIKKADLIITGEGKIDHQTLEGKMISGICAMAQKYHKEVWAFCGINELSVEQAQELGLAKIKSIRPAHMSIEDSITNTLQLLEISAKSMASDMFIK